MKIGIFLTFLSPRGTPEMIADFGTRAEDLGLDSIWLGEHVVLFDEMEFPYPGARDGKIPVPEGGGLLDTVASFGFLAATTKTLQLGGQRPESISKRFAELEKLVEAAA